MEGEGWKIFLRMIGEYVDQGSGGRGREEGEYRNTCE